MAHNSNTGGNNRANTGNQSTRHTHRKQKSSDKSNARSREPKNEPARDYYPRFDQMTPISPVTARAIAIH